MVLPPVKFKHTSVLGKVGVLADGNISFSRKHLWDAESWGLHVETDEQAVVSSRVRKCDLTVRVIEQAMKVASKFPEALASLIEALPIELALAEESLKVCALF